MRGQQGKAWVAGLIAFCALAWPAFAQRDDAAMRRLLPPELLGRAQPSAAERATIERALDDLRSENPERRAGAAMLLGKYHTANAQEAVLRALADPSARVRRAALVSVAEWQHGVPFHAVEPVLRRLADDDVEVRRAASAMIPQMMAIRRTAAMVRPGAGRTPLPPDIQAAVRAGYEDTDAVVRRNLLLHYHQLGVSVPSEIFVERMQDPDPDVRREAIPLAIGYAEPAQWKPAARAIIDGDNDRERTRLVTELARRGSPEALDLMRELAGDADPAIAAEARLALFRWTGEPPQLEWLVDALRAGRLSQEQGRRLLQTLRGYRELARPLAPALTELRDTVLRQEAARLFFALELGESHPEVLARLLTDHNAEVRALALASLDERAATLTDEQLQALLDNPWPDARLAVAELAIHRNRATAADWLFDLLLDEDAGVRVEALDALAGLRSPGWERAVAASLQDPDPALQRTALLIVMREDTFPDREVLLGDYAKRHPRSPLTPRVKAEIDAGELIEIDMNP